MRARPTEPAAARGQQGSRPAGRAGIRPRGLARACGVSLRQLERSFHATMGVSPSFKARRALEDTVRYFNDLKGYPE